MKVKRGDIIYLKNPIPMKNHIQGGNRPYVVVSNNKGNYYSEICIIVPLTRTKKKVLPTHTKISYNNSVCLCEQIFTVSQKEIETVVSHLNYRDMDKITNCLFTSIGG